MTKAGQHDIIVGGAPAHVRVYPANLLVEIPQCFNVSADEGVLHCWQSAALHRLDAIRLPVKVEVALISRGGRLVEVHDSEEGLFDPGYLFVAAVVMPKGWFDLNCTSSACVLNLD